MTPTSTNTEWRARIESDAARARARSEIASLRQQLKQFTCAAALKAAPSLSVVASPEPAFHFAWPAPGRASVVETSMKSGRVARLRYALELGERSAADGSFEVRLTDFELLEADGRDGTDPQFVMRARGFHKIAATIPPLHLDASGRYVGIGDASAVLEQLKELGAEVSVERLDAMHPLLAKFWFAWSHVWEGLALEPDTGFSSTPIRFRLHGGVEHASEARTTRRRRDGLWNVTLRAESPPFAESPFREAIAAALDSGKRLKKSAELPDLRVTLELEALLDTEARLPRFVARDISARAANGKFEAHEVQCWEFDWEP